ncbi:unnamed protein product [Vitrella brassicaformis CCMP3155]|uniref:Uncharacterized protein n=1 Tax=Vitrella brassicaformis (strain CCMP3155) TaxID=1169540 RepID=A0A0G4G0J0_VITBC|nr:unnamed protein product [Vitrella brassicaformis CCMP3155]|eukprot:CEM21279.1 unnamed protein product [Vitrella brassicaformis CCMP3155]
MHYEAMQDVQDALEARLRCLAAARESSPSSHKPGPDSGPSPSASTEDLQCPGREGGGVSEEGELGDGETRCIADKLSNLVQFSCPLYWPAFLRNTLLHPDDTQRVRRHSVERRVAAAERLVRVAERWYQRGCFANAIESYERAAGMFHYGLCMNPNWRRDGFRDDDVRVVRDFKAPTLELSYRAKNIAFDCYAHLGVCYLKRAQFMDAYEAACEALQLDPYNRIALYARGFSRLGLLLSCCADAAGDWLGWDGRQPVDVPRPGGGKDTRPRQDPRIVVTLTIRDLKLCLYLDPPNPTQAPSKGPGRAAAAKRFSHEMPLLASLTDRITALQHIRLRVDLEYERRMLRKEWRAKLRMEQPRERGRKECTAGTTRGDVDVEGRDYIVHAGERVSLRRTLWERDALQLLALESPILTTDPALAHRTADGQLTRSGLLKLPTAADDRIAMGSDASSASDEGESGDDSRGEDAAVWSGVPLGSKRPSAAEKCVIVAAESPPQAAAPGAAAGEGGGGGGECVDEDGNIYYDAGVEDDAVDAGCREEALLRQEFHAVSRAAHELGPRVDELAMIQDQEWTRAEVIRQTQARLRCFVDGLERLQAHYENEGLDGDEDAMKHKLEEVRALQRHLTCSQELLTLAAEVKGIKEGLQGNDPHADISAAISSYRDRINAALVDMKEIGDITADAAPADTAGYGLVSRYHGLSGIVTPERVQEMWDQATRDTPITTTTTSQPSHQPPPIPSDGRRRVAERVASAPPACWECFVRGLTVLWGLIVCAVRWLASSVCGADATGAKLAAANKSGRHDNELNRQDGRCGESASAEECGEPPPSPLVHPAEIPETDRHKLHNPPPPEKTPEVSSGGREAEDPDHPHTRITSTKSTPSFTTPLPIKQPLQTASKSSRVPAPAPAAPAASETRLLSAVDEGGKAGSSRVRRAEVGGGGVRGMSSCEERLYAKWYESDLLPYSWAQMESFYVTGPLVWRADNHFTTSILVASGVLLGLYMMECLYAEPQPIRL